MVFKTLLVHLADDEGHGARLAAAFDLARRFEAHITALYVLTPADMPVAIEGRGASVEYIAEATAIAREKAAAMEAEFRKRCEKKKISWEWRCVAGEHLKLLAEHSFVADLAIVSEQEPHGIDEVITMHGPDYLPLVAGCPVLVLPRAGKTDVAAKRVLVAWTPSRETLRAVRDGLPFLAQSKKIFLLAVDPRERDDDPGVGIKTFLARHGLEVEAEFRPSRGIDRVGEAIIAAADKFGADLIVMGAYGHSRLYELIVGGATRHVLGHMTLPVLMSH